MKIISQKEQIQNLASQMKSINPSVYIPPSNDERLWRAVVETLRKYRGSEIGMVASRIMLGEDPQKICEYMKIDKNKLSMCLSYFIQDVMSVYKSRLPKKEQNKKGWW